jgi:hypothetical protein
MVARGAIRTSCNKCLRVLKMRTLFCYIFIYKVAHAQSDLLGGGHGGGELGAGQPAPALCQGNLLYIHKVAHAQSDLLGGGHGGGQLRAGRPPPALCEGNLLYIHKVAHAQSDLLGGVPPGGGGHGGGELCAGQPAPALSQGVQVCRHVRQLHQLRQIQH